ncbi:SurA N-terminal domain-containing protein [Rugamonas sp.]|uniref:SurA N-terminal domain-containing protein n=1 Tax=Rugamonas sp. TaxID=1926287 RepID=UPI0025EDDD5A|nr:SurA N-terminal domain-containing protein [Rugamonas sp.]
MFEFIRTHQRLMQFLLALLIIPFMFAGVSGGVQLFSENANTIAKVDGKPLTQQEFEAGVRQQLDSYRQRMGAQFDQKMFDTPEFKQNVFDSLVAQRSLAAEVSRSHLTVSDEALHKEILERFAQLRAADGKFDTATYVAVLRQQGMSPSQYEASVRREMALQQVGYAVEGTAFSPRTVATQISDLGAQEREVQELMLPVSDFVSQVKVSDEMVKAFYGKNSQFFQIPEQAKIEYVVLSPTAVQDQVSVTDAEVAAFYAQEQKRYTSPESRRASHILVAVKKDASAADKAAAKAKAEAILADVRKNPADFAKIAKAKSEDPVSAEQGGDLDVVEKGALPKPLEDAVYRLKQGEISDVVASEFGYHIVTVTALKPAVVKPLDEVKNDIVADLKKQKAGKKYSEMAEQFNNTVYEQSDSLKPVADKLKLTVETATVTRTPSPALGAAPFNNAKFLTALFSADALKSKRNTEAVEAAPSTLISARIVDYKPASKRPLAEVADQIRQRVTMDEALKLAQKTGADKLAAFQKSGDATGFGAVKTVSRAKAEGLNGLAAQQVLKADTAKLPAYVGVDIPGQGYGIYRIGKVGQPAQPDVAARQSDAENIARALGQQELFDYVEVLKLKSKVKVIKPVASLTGTAESAPEPQ